MTKSSTPEGRFAALFARSGAAATAVEVDDVTYYVTRGTGEGVFAYEEDAFEAGLAAAEAATTEPPYQAFCDAADAERDVPALARAIHTALDVRICNPGACDEMALASVDVEHVDGDGIALYNKYPGQSAPQPCFVELQCEKRTLTAESTPEINNAVPAWVWYGRILRWTIPVLTDDAANALLDELADDAAILCDGYSCEWDGSNHVGKLNSSAAAARERIAATIEGKAWSDHDQVQVYDAADWFSGEGQSETVRRLGITADTTDEQLAEIAEREEESASADGYTLEGTVGHLTWLRDRERE